MLVAVFVVSMLTHHTLHFTDCNDRQVFAEQAEQGRKQSKASHQHANVDPGRLEVAPTGRQEVST